MSTKVEATIEDLYHVPENGKAEIIDGELVLMPPTGFLPGRKSSRICRKLEDYEEQTKSGYAIPDNVAFIVNLPRRGRLPSRRSFAPDAAYFIGEVKEPGKFLEGAPVFAVEVRSEGDYGAGAERKLADKRQDYFDAGTLVVWDADVLREGIIKSYRASDPETPHIFRRGDEANAGHALPGWRVSVDEILD